MTKLGRTLIFVLLLIGAGSGQALAQEKSDASALSDRMEKTEQTLRERIESSRLNDLPEARGEHLFALAELRRQQGRLDDAHAHLVEAYALQREANAHAARAKTSLALSLVLKQLGRLRSAEDAARDALVLDSDLPIVSGALNQLEQIAVVYSGRGDYDEERRVLGDIVSIRDPALADLQKIDDYLKLAQQSLDSGAFGRVKDLGEDIVQFSARHDAWRQSAQAYELMAAALKEQDQAAEALQLYKQGLEFARRCGQCDLARRLTVAVTDVSRTQTLILKDNPTEKKRRGSPNVRFEPLPR
ncbi:MAG: tetratricopeptide repeat protein [Gammaproteobacteria bacterium]